MKVPVAILVNSETDDVSKKEVMALFEGDMFETKQYKLMVKETPDHRLSHSSYYRAQVRNVLLDQTDSNYVLIVPSSTESELSAKAVSHRIRRLIDGGFDVSHPFDDYSLLLSRKAQRVLLEEKEKIGIHAILGKHITARTLSSGKLDKTSSSYLVKADTDHYTTEEKSEPLALYWYVLTIVISLIILYFLSWVI